MSQHKYLGNPGPEDIAEASAIQSRSGWTHALAIPCERHHVPACVPCWSWAGDIGEGPHSGLCARRCTDAGIPPVPTKAAGRHPSTLEARTRAVNAGRIDIARSQNHGALDL